MNRRSFLQALAVGGATAAAGTAVGATVGGAAAWSFKPAPSSTDQRFYADTLLGGDQAEVKPLWYRFKWVDQPIMDTQSLFFLSTVSQQLADVGEVLDTVLSINRGDEVGWFEAWLGTAKRVQNWGEEAERKGRLRTAAAHYLRAATYYRAGLMRYADPADPRMNDAVHTTLRLHGRALELKGYDTREVLIPYAGSSIYGRFHRSKHAVGPAPTLLLFQGLHAWPEDTWWAVSEALARGYHVLTFHGPGQCATLRLYGLPFQPDWEKPVSAVVDFASAMPEVDASRLALMGLSFGGHLVVRAAAFEKRLKCIIADPGVVNWGAQMLSHFNDIPGLMSMHASSPAAFDRTVQAIGAAWPDADWYFRDATWKHGVDTPHALIDELIKYDNTAVINKITADVLIMDGVAEDVTPGQAKQLHDLLRCPKTFMQFDAQSGAQTHCQAGGFILAQHRLLDWMDEHLA